MTRRRAPWIVLLWFLVTSRDPSVPLDDWQVTGQFPTSDICDQAREGTAGEAASRELGAMATLDAQNPARLVAYDKAYRRVSARYRCVEQE
ncbi:MAG TPA: hypothetical protein VGR62_13835 [Candidatus Binatia bacterium]|jgi:hypothetical protein|nr:hypothetical protein [Candidatus Binatia bacterium]